MAPPQLRMVHRLADLPAERPMPTGLKLRTAIASDAGPVGRVLESAFGDSWPLERVTAELLANPNVPFTFLIEDEESVLATASYQLKPEFDLKVGWLHWVGVLPAAQGKALGEIVSHRVLVEARARGNKAIMLSTDDFRIPAIRTYLRLGFEPEQSDDSHPERWAAVLNTLKAGAVGPATAQLESRAQDR